jgi:transcriptional regulator with XRE-family HTH domain
MASYKQLLDPNEIIAQRRQELNLSQGELARKLSYPSINFISMLEAKKSKVPIERAADIADALEMDPKWFIECVLRDRHPNIAEVIYGKKRNK